MNMNYVVVSLSIVLIFTTGHQVFKVGFGIMYSISVIITMALAFFLQFKMRSENRKLKVIGDIEFTRSEIIKHIGDSVEEFSYHSIQKIELEKHIPAVNMAESKSGYFTYILSLSFIDSRRESIVVSDKPLDKRQNLCITETIKTLKNITRTEIVIKK